jgi:hypothetical protein
MPTTPEIRAVVKRPGEPPAVEMIGSDLASLQAAVGGYIEAIHLGQWLGFLPWCMTGSSYREHLAVRFYVVKTLDGEDSHTLVLIDGQEPEARARIGRLFHERKHSCSA